MNWLYFDRLRTFLRQIGVLKTFSFFAWIRTQIYYCVYSLKNPSKIKIKVRDSFAIVLVEDKFEYARILSFNDDKNIISKLLSRIKLGDIYWDIGASIGLYSVLLAKAIGENGMVVAFEPEERSFIRLKQNIEINELHNIYPLQIALGKENKKEKLMISKQFSSGTHSVFNVSNVKEKEVDYEIINISTGDKLRTDKGLQVPSVVKIDVEGAEEDVIVGLEKTLKNDKCHTVVCEVHFAILNSVGKSEVPFKIQQRLLTNGFKELKWLDHSHLCATKELVSFNI